MSDGTIEENFEEAFGLPSLIPEYPSLIPEQRDSLKELDVDDFIDVAQHRIVDVVGDDTYGRKVIGMFLLFHHSNHCFFYLFFIIFC